MARLFATPRKTRPASSQSGDAVSSGGNVTEWGLGYGPALTADRFPPRDEGIPEDASRSVGESGAASLRRSLPQQRGEVLDHDEAAFFVFGSGSCNRQKPLIVRLNIELGVKPARQEIGRPLEEALA